MFTSTKKYRKKSHTSRNIVVLGLTIIAIVVAAVVLSTPPLHFFMTVHAYDAPVEYTSLEQLPEAALLNDTVRLTLTLSGPQNFGPATTNGGITGIPTPLLGGNYNITATAPGYVARTIQFLVSADCPIKSMTTTGTVICHVLMRMSRSS